MQASTVPILGRTVGELMLEPFLRDVGNQWVSQSFFGHFFYWWRDGHTLLTMGVSLAAKGFYTSHPLWCHRNGRATTTNLPLFRPWTRQWLMILRWKLTPNRPWLSWHQEGNFPAIFNSFAMPPTPSSFETVAMPATTRCWFKIHEDWHTDGIAPKYMVQYE